MNEGGEARTKGEREGGGRREEGGGRREFVSEFVRGGREFRSSSS